MATQSNKALLILSSVVVIGGTVTYLLWKQGVFKGKGKPKDGEKPKEEGVKDEQKQPSPTPTPTPSTPVQPSELPTTSDVRNFQRFAKTKGANLGVSGIDKDGVDGIWGSKSQLAWDMYGIEYINTIKAMGNKLDMKTLKSFLSSWVTTSNSDSKLQIASGVSDPRAYVSFYSNGLMTVEKNKLGQSNTSYGKTDGSWYFRAGIGYLNLNGREYVLKAGGNAVWDMLKDAKFVDNSGVFVAFSGESMIDFMN